MERQDHTRERNRRFLAACAQHLPQGVSLIWFQRADRPELGSRFCALCRRCLGDSAFASQCVQSARLAAYEASLIGEPYFFRCWLGLNSFAAPIWERKKLVGAAVFGGYFYEENAAAELEWVRDGLPPRWREQLLPELARVIRLPAAEMRGHAAFVAEALLAHGFHDPGMPRQRQESYLQQRRIAELMHGRGGAAGAGPEFWGGLAALAAAVQQGQREGAMLRLDEYLCHCMLAHASAPDRFRASLLLLSAVLEHQVLQRPAPEAGCASPLLAAGVRLQVAWRELERAGEVDELCAWAARQVDAALAHRPATPAAAGARGALALRIDAWLERQFQNKVTLAAAGRAVGASVPAIVSALRRHGGGTFHERLTHLRVRHAKRLLATTAQPLHAIARECGFADQSHLNRVFHGQISLTPGQFRRLLDWDERQLAGDATDAEFAP